MKTYTKNFQLTVKDFDVVLYHSRCSDGIGAAYPFWRENKDRYLSSEETNQEIKIGNPLQILEVYDRENFPEEIEGKNVAILDFSHTRETLKQMSSLAKTIFLIDHHKTAERHLIGLEEELDNFYYIFDMNRSAAQIAWNWAYPSKSQPWFIEYIADRDLWQWKLPNSKLINKGLFHMDWISWGKMEILYNQNKNDGLNDLLTQGKIIHHIDQKNIEYTCENATLCQFNEYKVKLTTSCPHLRSEIGNRLANEGGCDFAVSAQYYFESDIWSVSVRGGDDSSLDVSKVCELYGGGGHPKAGSFKIYGVQSDKYQKLKGNPDGKSLFGTLRTHFKLIKDR